MNVVQFEEYATECKSTIENYRSEAKEFAEMLIYNSVPFFGIIPNDELPIFFALCESELSLLGIDDWHTFIDPTVCVCWDISNTARALDKALDPEEQVKILFDRAKAFNSLLETEVNWQEVVSALAGRPYDIDPLGDTISLEVAVRTLHTFCIEHRLLIPPLCLLRVEPIQEMWDNFKTRADLEKLLNSWRISPLDFARFFTLSHNYAVAAFEDNRHKWPLQLFMESLPQYNRPLDELVEEMICLGYSPFINVRIYCQEAALELNTGRVPHSPYKKSLARLKKALESKL